MITGSIGSSITGNGVVTMMFPPSTPTNLTVSNITSSSATINFDTAPIIDNVVGYQVYVNGSMFVLFQTSSITLPDLSPATNYTVSLLAFNIYGNSAMSDSVSFTTL